MGILKLIVVVVVESTQKIKLYISWLKGIKWTKTMISTKAVGGGGQNGGNSPISSFVMSAGFSQAWMHKNHH